MSYSYWMLNRSFRIHVDNFKHVIRDVVHAYGHIEETVVDKHGYTRIESTYNSKNDRKNMELIFSDKGLELEFNNNGDVCDVVQAGELAADEYMSEFFELISPYVEHDSFICWVGQDHDYWRDRFVHGQHTQEIGMVVYDHTPHKSVPGHECPVKEIAGNETCAKCPFGMLCLSSDHPELSIQACGTCGGEVIVRRGSGQSELIARVTCTCNTHAPRWALLQPLNREKNEK